MDSEECGNIDSLLSLQGTDRRQFHYYPLSHNLHLSQGFTLTDLV